MSSLITAVGTPPTSHKSAQSMVPQKRRICDGKDQDHSKSAESPESDIVRNPSLDLRTPEIDFVAAAKDVDHLRRALHLHLYNALVRQFNAVDYDNDMVMQLRKKFGYVKNLFDSNGKVRLPSLTNLNRMFESEDPLATWNEIEGSPGFCVSAGEHLPVPSLLWTATHQLNALKNIASFYYEKSAFLQHFQRKRDYVVYGEIQSTKIGGYMNVDIQHLWESPLRRVTGNAFPLITMKCVQPIPQYKLGLVLNNNGIVVDLFQVGAPFHFWLAGHVNGLDVLYCNHPRKNGNGGVRFFISKRHSADRCVARPSAKSFKKQKLLPEAATLNDFETWTSNPNAKGGYTSCE